MKNRGTILLEVLIAIAIFVGAGLAILGAAMRGERAVRRVREQEQAADLVRSALSAIEAGLATPQNVATLVRSAPGAGPRLVLDAEGMIDAGGGEGAWTLDVQAEPSAVTGLSLVTVRASKGEVESPTTSFSMKQLVRLTSESQEGPGEADALGEAAGRGPRGGGGRREGGSR